MNPYGIERLIKQRNELDKMIDNYQAISNQPVNNFISTSQESNDTYEMKFLNEQDEVENIFVKKNTIFVGKDRMQIKKIDGTIEKYKIEKYYPVDEKDEEIKKLNKKVEELERILNNGPKEYDKSTNEIDQPYVDANVDGKPKSKANGK